jgi:hypothetical protein
LGVFETRRGGIPAATMSALKRFGSDKILDLLYGNLFFI